MSLLNINEMSNENNIQLKPVSNITHYAKAYDIPIMYWNEKYEQYPSIIRDDYNKYNNGKTLTIKNKQNNTMTYNKDTTKEYITLIYNNGSTYCDYPFVVIDIDEIEGSENIHFNDKLTYALSKLPKIILDNSYISLSRNKYLPHIHIYITDMPDFTNENKILNINGLIGDIKRSYIWERTSHDIYVSSTTNIKIDYNELEQHHKYPINPPSISYNDIKQYLDEEKMNIINDDTKSRRDKITINNDDAKEIYDLFTKSSYYKLNVHSLADYNENGLISIAENMPYKCLSCNKMHLKNSNRGFLWKSKNGTIYYKCRDYVKEAKVIFRPLNILIKQECMIEDEKEDLEPALKIKSKTKQKSENNETNQKEDDPKPFIKENDEFKQLVYKFEKTHAKILNKNIYIKQILDNNNNMTDVLFLTVKNIREMYSHISYNKYIYKGIDENGQNIYEPQKRIFIDDWTRGYDNIKIYNNIDVYPYTSEEDNKCPEDTFNLWIKFDMEYIKTYDVKQKERDALLNHIKILCNNDNEIYNWLIEWIAHCIQKPYEKSGKVPVFISKQGAGKGTLMLLLSKMLGRNRVFETASPEKDVFCRFNGMLKDAFIINMNEIKRKDIQNDAGELKKLATDPTIKLELKGKDPIDIASYHRIIITTNDDIPIQSTKDDRRNIIIRCSDEVVGDAEYFKQLYDYLDDVNVIKSCYEYFKSYKVDNNFKNKKPKLTEYQEEIQQTFTSPIEIFMENLTKSYKQSKTEEIDITTDDLYNKFKDWCVEKQISYNIDKLKFSVRLTAINITGISTINGRIKKKLLDINKMCKYFKIDEQALLIEEEKKEEPKKEEPKKEEPKKEEPIEEDEDIINNNEFSESTDELDIF
jgi:hypothetical protein